MSSMAMTVANAGEKIFDLRDQYFSETMKNSDNTKIGKYDLPKVSVSTNAWYQTDNQTYIPRDNTGAFMLLNIKQPIADWKYLETKIYDSSSRRQYANIKFTSDNGNSFFINVGATNISVNGKSFEMVLPDNNAVYAISVEKSANIMTTIINGKELLKANIQDFGNLSKVETTMTKWDYNSIREGKDELRSSELYAQ